MGGMRYVVVYYYWFVCWLLVGCSLAFVSCLLLVVSYALLKKSVGCLLFVVCLFGVCLLIVVVVGRVLLVVCCASGC